MQFPLWIPNVIYHCITFGLGCSLRLYICSISWLSNGTCLSGFLPGPWGSTEVWGSEEGEQKCWFRTGSNTGYHVDRVGSQCLPKGDKFWARWNDGGFLAVLAWCRFGENDMKDSCSLLDHQKAWGYCWWKESCTTDVWIPVNNGINYQPELVIAGFLPSTVSTRSAAPVVVLNSKLIQQDLMLDADERATKYSIWLRWRFGVYCCISKSILWRQAHIFTPNVFFLFMLSG